MAAIYDRQAAGKTRDETVQINAGIIKTVAKLELQSQVALRLFLMAIFPNSRAANFQKLKQNGIILVVTRKPSRSAIYLTRFFFFC